MCGACRKDRFKSFTWPEHETMMRCITLYHEGFTLNQILEIVEVVDPLNAAYWIEEYA